VAEVPLPAAGRRFAMGVLTWLTWLHLAALVTALVALRFIGERWWLTGVLLYVPRVFVLLPCLLLVPSLLVVGPRRLLLVQLLTVWLAVFVGMGFVLPALRAHAGSKSLRLMSYNVRSCSCGQAELATRIESYAPDVVVLQELCGESNELVARLRQHYAVVHTWDQFLLASRYPLLSVRKPGGFQQGGEQHNERFMRYELDTTLGRIAFYSMHPLSPHEAFHALRGVPIMPALRDGSIWHGGSAEATLRDNFRVRDRQLSAASALAAADTRPRVLMGDTNLAGLSPWAERYFGAYRDAFESAGSGFGYTFPSIVPWLRLDRMFASPDLRFVHFETGCDRDSDHLCVLAQLELSGP
jgi:vancomycin resistance protein VanJ